MFSVKIRGIYLLALKYIHTHEQGPQSGGICTPYLGNLRLNLEAEIAKAIDNGSIRFIYFLPPPFQRFGSIYGGTCLCRDGDAYVYMDCIHRHVVRGSDGDRG
jgi:hypothetical protein